jgi:hypothetical protein
VPHRSTAFTREHFRDRPHISDRDLFGFRDYLDMTVMLVEALTKERWRVAELVQLKTTRAAWVIRVRVGRVYRSMRLDGDDEALVDSTHHDERRFIALHLFVKKLLEDLIADRLELALGLHHTAKFRAVHSVHYRPRNVLGYLVAQLVTGMNTRGKQWQTCSICGRSMLRRAGTLTCDDACRKERSRRALTAN